MEVHRSLSESTADIIVQSECALNETRHLLLHLRLEVFQVALQEGVVDGKQRLIVGHVNCHKPEMSLISRVHVERSRRRVHAGQMLAVHDLLNGQFANIVPMCVVSMLSQKRDSGLSVIRIQLGHIQIIDVINHFDFTAWAVLLTGQLLQRSLKHILQIA